jgi:SAM-dependent methyltransferase
VKYDGRAWDAGPARVYEPLAQALVESSSLRGHFVLDIGTGTGAVAKAARRAGATVVGLDASCDMLQQHHADGVRVGVVVAGDALRLPVRSGAFDACIAAFVLNHVDAAIALTEAARVLRPRGLMLASTWPVGVHDPVKTALDAVARDAGWSPPGWYGAMKGKLEAVSGDPLRLRAAALDAGFACASADVRSIDVGEVEPAAAVAYRYAMPQFDGWSAARDEGVLARARVAVAPLLTAWRVSVLVLSCTRAAW